MKGSCLIVAIGLIAASALAGPEIMPVKGVKHLVYDMATGKLTPTEGATRIGESVWASTQLSGFYLIQMSRGEGATTLDWGDIAGPQPIGGYSLAYGTHSVLLPERIDVVNLFFADDDGWNSAGRTYLAGFVIPNLPGWNPAGWWNTWVVTVDLDPSGLAFTIDGSDLDGDGLMDFGYTYWFTNYVQNNPQYPHNYLGPLIAGDPNAGTAPGIENAIDFFADPNLNVYWGTYWLGSPFGQTYMELYDSEPVGCPEAGGSGKYCTADIWPNNGDGVWDYGVDGDCLVELADLAQLLSNYPTLGGATHEMGDVWPENGDGIWQDGVDGDGSIELHDLAELLSQYDDNCR